MRILVTGGAGFIGSHVADACVAAGHEVSVVDSLRGGHRGNVPTQARFHEADIRNPEQLEEIFSAEKPEIVCHQAAQTSVSVSAREPVLDADINVLGTLQVLQKCVQHGVQHVVFASTGGAIYGEVPEGRAGLETIPRPLSPYACSKFAVEQYLNSYRAEHGLQSTVLRYANVYGPRQDPHGEAGVIAIFCERLLRGEPIVVNARQHPGDEGCIRDYVFVADVVRANMKAIEGTLGAPMINVCTGEATATRTLAANLRELIGSESTVGDAPRREGDVQRSVLDPGDPCPLGDLVQLQEGLRRTVDWYRQR